MFEFFPGGKMCVMKMHCENILGKKISIFLHVWALVHSIWTLHSLLPNPLAGNTTETSDFPKG